MPRPSRLLNSIACRYEQLQAGRTGISTRDLLIPLERLLDDARCSEGEERALAERELQELQKAGVLVLAELSQLRAYCSRKCFLFIKAISQVGTTFSVSAAGAGRPPAEP
jgi:hypothetical protein